MTTEVGEISILIRAGRLTEAESLARLACENNPRNMDAWYLQAAVHSMQGHWQEVARCCQRVIALDAGHVEAHYNLAAAQASLGQFPEAVTAFQRVVGLEPSFADAWTGLASTFLALGRADEAAVSYRKALQLKPQDARIQFDLGCTLQRLGRPAEARPHFEAAIALDPKLTDAHGRLGSVCADMGRWNDAIRSFNRVLELEPHHLSALLNLGAALRAAGRSAEAAAVYGNALALHPDSELARYFAATVGAEAAPSQSPEEYVKVLFDNYAGRFEEHLVHTLQYRTPSLMATTLREMPGGVSADASILDLGCGTGLVGVSLRASAGRLTGVDLSERMIEEVAKRGLYDELHVAEIGAFLAGPCAIYDLIVAADVFIYVGDLAGIFASVTAHLRPGGRFAFSVERHAGNEPYALRPSGRYAHSPAYVRSLASTTGLREVRCVEHTVRVEAGTAIVGDLFVLQARD